MNSESSSREMSPAKYHDVLTSPIRERLPTAEPPRGYQSEGHGGLQLSRGYSGYIIPLSIGLGIGAGYGTYRVFGRFKENPTDVNSSKPTPTPTIKPNIMRNRRYQSEGHGGLQKSRGFHSKPN